MNLQDSTVIVFLLLYGITTLWAGYDICQDRKLKTVHKVLLILLIMAIPLFASMLYIFRKGNSELEEKMFY